MACWDSGSQDRRRNQKQHACIYHSGNFPRLMRNSRLLHEVEGGDKIKKKKKYSKKTMKAC